MAASSAASTTCASSASSCAPKCSRMSVNYRQMCPALANSCPTPAERARLPLLPALNQAVLPRRAHAACRRQHNPVPRTQHVASAAITDSPNQGIPDTQPPTSLLLPYMPSQGPSARPWPALTCTPSAAASPDTLTLPQMPTQCSSRKQPCFTCSPLVQEAASGEGLGRTRVSGPSARPWPALTCAPSAPSTAVTRTASTRASAPAAFPRTTASPSVTASRAAAAA